MRLELTVNGRRWRGDVEARLTLADLIRERLGLTGTHLGCEHGVCGACTVLLDGQAARSCLTLAVQVQGQAVTTVEGLPEELLPWSVFQCGFCRAGFLASAAGLMSQGRRYDRDDLRVLLAGNVCRCAGYEQIVEALLRWQR